MNLPALPQQWFELFEMPSAFAVDLVALKERYQKLSRSYHPDRFVGQDDATRRLAMQYTTLINEAYEGLKVPRTRAKYLLEQAGVLIDEERDTIRDADFLMAQMEWHEAVEQASETDDEMAALDMLEELEVKIKAIDQICQGEFEQAWQNQEHSEAKKQVLKMRFIERLSDTIANHRARIEDAL